MSRFPEVFLLYINSQKHKHPVMGFGTNPGFHYIRHPRDRAVNVGLEIDVKCLLMTLPSDSPSFAFVDHVKDITSHSALYIESP